MKVRTSFDLLTGVSRLRKPYQAGGSARGSTLPFYLTDLRAEYQAGRIRRAPLRSAICSKIADALNQPGNNSVIVIGESGVGKTRIIDHFIHEIASGQHRSFAGYRLLRLNVHDLRTGFKELEARFRQLQELTAEDRTIIFIDEIEEFYEIQGESGRLVGSLRSALDSGKLTIVGATTREKYNNTFTKDPSLNRRFSLLEVEEPSVDITVDILEEEKPGIEKHFSEKAGMPVTIHSAALRKAAEYSAKYLRSRFLPEKARELLKMAISRKVGLPSALQAKLEENLTRIAIEINRRSRTVKAKRAVAALVEEYLSVKVKLNEVGRSGMIEITEEDILASVSDLSKIPLGKLQQSDMERYQNLEAELGKRVIGQSAPLHELAAAARRNFFSRLDPKKPIGVFFFAGPTGVGKTETALALAEALFGDESAVVRLDMNQYAKEDALNRLTGASRGYKDSELGSELDVILERPYSVILLDEFEKAYPPIYKFFMNIFDTGRSVTPLGRTIDFSNTIIILTSNLGTEAVQAALKESRSPEAADASIKRELEKAMINHGFPPEFIGRLTKLVYYNELNGNMADQILSLKLKKTAERLQEDRQIELEVTAEARQHILNSGVDLKLGARPLVGAIDSLITTPLTDMFFGGKLKKGQKVVVNAKNGQLIFAVENRISTETDFIPTLTRGRPGMLMRKVLNLLDDPGGNSVSVEDIRKILQVPPEVLLDYLKRNEGLTAQKAELSNFDPARKDPQVNEQVKKLESLIENLSLNANAKRVIGSWLRQLSAYAKRANTGRPSPFVHIEHDLNSGELKIKISSPPLVAEDQNRLTSNFLEPSPRSRDESEQLVRDLEANGDLVLLELKRAVIEARAQVGMETNAEKTELWIRFPLSDKEFSAVDVRFSNMSDREVVEYLLKSNQLEEAREVVRSSGDRVAIELYESYKKEENIERAAEALRLVQDPKMRRRNTLTLIHDCLFSQNPKSYEFIKTIIESTASDLGTEAAGKLLNILLNLIFGSADKLRAEGRRDNSLWFYEQIIQVLLNLEIANINLPEMAKTVLSQANSDGDYDFVLEQLNLISVKWHILELLESTIGGLIDSKDYVENAVIFENIRHPYYRAFGLVRLHELSALDEMDPLNYDDALPLLNTATGALQEFASKYPQTEQTQKLVSDLRTRIETLKRTIFDRLVNEKKYEKAIEYAAISDNPAGNYALIYVSAFRSGDRKNSGEAWNRAMALTRAEKAPDIVYVDLIEAETELKNHESALSLLTKLGFVTVFEDMAPGVVLAALKDKGADFIHQYATGGDDCGEDGYYSFVDFPYYRASLLFHLTNVYYSETGRKRQDWVSQAHGALNEFEQQYQMTSQVRDEIKDLRRKLTILRAAMNSGQKPVY
ncbi:ATP-dependent Clp protease ATP-binding subunit [Candidatus Saganbacteria bacterium]|nr:ATP-dependent Clp protease ATP-binding subunit [Candidatus Saganbacteria bacterium]